MIHLQKLQNLTVFGVTAFIFSSCSNASVDLVKTLQSSFDYHNKQVELQGEFDSPFFMFRSQNSTTIPMSFVVKPHAFSSEKFSVSDVILPMGTSKNNVSLDMMPDQKEYTLKDFTIYDDQGEKHNLDQHPGFKITGTVHYSEMDKPESERKADNFAFKITDIKVIKD